MSERCSLVPAFLDVYRNAQLPFRKWHRTVRKKRQGFAKPVLIPLHLGQLEPSAHEPFPAAMSQEKAGLPAMKSDIFGFVEKEDVPYAIEKLSGDIFRMDARDPERRFEIKDPDNRCRIRLNSSSISESEAMLLADEMSEDIAALR